MKQNKIKEMTKKVCLLGQKELRTTKNEGKVRLFAMAIN